MLVFQLLLLFRNSSFHATSVCQYYSNSPCYVITLSFHRSRNRSGQMTDIATEDSRPEGLNVTVIDDLPEQPDIPMTTTTFRQASHVTVSNEGEQSKPQHILTINVEYAIPNKVIALQKAADRQNELSLTESGNNSTSVDVRPKDTPTSQLGVTMGDEAGYSSIGGQHITYASIENREMRVEEEGEDEDDEGYTTGTRRRTPACQNVDDDEDDDVSLQDNPLYC